MEGTTVSTILTSVSQFVTGVFDWVSQFSTLIMDKPLLLLMCVAVPLVGIGVGLLKRLIHVN